MTRTNVGRGAVPLTKTLAGVLIVIASSAGFAQIAGVSDTVEVTVFNFEVVVTDTTGLPIRGLGKDDFELLIDGEPREIDYFSSVEDGAVVESGGIEAESAELRPFLIVVWDGRELEAGWAGRTIEELGARLGDLTALTRGIMVVRQGMSLETEQVFTSDGALVAAALARAGARRMTSLDVGERNALIRRIETSDSPAGGIAATDLLRIEAQAEQFLQEIRAQQRLENFALDRGTAQLRALIQSLAGLPGRKEVLYLGRGFKTQAAEPLFELWWRKYSLIARNIGVLSMQSEMGLEGVDRKLLAVIEEANAQQISFNTFVPGGARSAGSNIAFSSIEATEVMDSESDRQRRFILTLARATGGVSRIQTSEIDGVIDEMVSGFRHFYSLGFQAEDGASGPGKVKVRVGGGYRVRHLDRYRIKRSRRTLEDLTLTALVTEMAENPLQASIDVDGAERQQDGTYVVPLLVKVPIARLALLPDGENHVGNVKLVVQAQSAAGDLSPPAHGEVPIEIANAELLNAMGQLAGYRLRMRVSEGEQKIAVALRDEIGRVDSTVRLIIDTGDVN